MSIGMFMDILLWLMGFIAGIVVTGYVLLDNIRELEKRNDKLREFIRANRREVK